MIQILSPKLLNYNFFSSLKKHTHTPLFREHARTLHFGLILLIYSMCQMGFVEICGPWIISWQIWAWENLQVPVSLGWVRSSLVFDLGLYPKQH